MANELKKNSSIKQSAGVAISWNNSILLVHPTNASWVRSFSIPKGIADEGEDLLSAAVRELKEETGISISKEDIQDVSQKLTVDYDQKGKIYKRLTVFFLFLDDEAKSRLQIPDKIPKQNLQLKEVDWAGFIPLSEVKNKIMPRLQPVIDLIMERPSRFSI